MKILHDPMIPDVEFHDPMIRVNLIMDHILAILDHMVMIQDHGIMGSVIRDH